MSLQARASEQSELLRRVSLHQAAAAPVSNGQVPGSQAAAQAVPEQVHGQEQDREAALRVAEARIVRLQERLVSRDTSARKYKVLSQARTPF